jgi:hypothetical protein
LKLGCVVKTRGLDDRSVTWRKRIEQVHKIKKRFDGVARDALELEDCVDTWVREVTEELSIVFDRLVRLKVVREALVR